MDRDPHRKVTAKGNLRMKYKNPAEKIPGCVGLSADGELLLRFELDVFPFIGRRGSSLLFKNFQ
jgi:hypothetical protein